MIIPAAIFRIVGFINKTAQTLENEVQEGGLVFCYSDQGNPLILKLESNKKETTLEDLKKYLINKRDSVIKQKEIDSVAGELDYIEDFEIELEDAIEKFKEENGNDRKAVLKFKKEYKNEKAKEIVYKRRTIGPGSVIKVVISLSEEKQQKEMFKGIEYNLIKSRCIIFDQENEPTTTGLYFYAQTPNAIPVSIKPIFNKEGEALNLFKISLSKVATIEHFNHLIDHMIRSVSRFIEAEENAFLPRLEYNYEKVKSLEIFKTIKKITELTKKKEVSYQEASKFIEYLLDIKIFVNKNKKYMLFIEPVFNLLVPVSYFDEALKKTSPLAKIKDTFVNLNFSKENPEEKSDKKKKIEKILKDISNGNRKSEIIGIYNTPALKISEPSDSWGFILNNLQEDSLVLSSIDTFKLFKEI